MNDETLKVFVELATQAMMETEAAIETVFKGYERHIEQLEEENAELRGIINRLETTSLLDAAFVVAKEQ